MKTIIKNVFLSYKTLVHCNTRFFVIMSDQGYRDYHKICLGVHVYFSQKTGCDMSFHLIYLNCYALLSKTNNKNILKYNQLVFESGE